MNQPHTLPNAPARNAAAWDQLAAGFFDPARVAQVTARNADRLRAMCFTTTAHAEPTITLEQPDDWQHPERFADQDEAEQASAEIAEDRAQLNAYVQDGPAARQARGFTMVPAAGGRREPSDQVRNHLRLVR